MYKIEEALDVMVDDIVVEIVGAAVALHESLQV